MKAASAPAPTRRRAPESDRSRSAPIYRCTMYGLSLQSDVPLGNPRHEGSYARADVAIRTFGDSSLQRVLNGAVVSAAASFQHARLPDGSIYLQWPGLAEFLLSPDGSQISCCVAPSVPPLSWHTYLLGPVLSFALVKKGIEPLHATVVVVDGKAVGFLGESGQGKSTLAASFVQRGYRLLTDDLLVVRERHGTVWACPGPRRIKLFPTEARELLGRLTAAAPMNPVTPKLVIPLPSTHAEDAAVPLQALYILRSSARISGGSANHFSRLRPRDALIELVKHTFNRVIVDSDRLQRQFEAASRLAASVPVRKLSYARDLKHLSQLRDELVRDLDSGAC
jgi:hypothetical protein